jgi:hypothetical protein
MPHTGSVSKDAAQSTFVSQCDTAVAKPCQASGFLLRCLQGFRCSSLVTLLDGLFLQVRDLENNFFMTLTNAVPSYLERYGSAADNPELEALPEEVQVMLGDKDSLLNAMQVITSHMAPADEPANEVKHGPNTQLNDCRHQSQLPSIKICTRFSLWIDVG